MPSYTKRNATIEELRTTVYDLLIIGGGITGAGIALDSSLRGLKTALVEKNDFAWGTSSRSTKLIHGGLRYLKQLEFGLVKEVGSERAIVHKLAPHLVVPEKMLLPLYESRGFGSLLTSVGLKLYDWLAGVKKEDRRRMLTKKQTLDQEPLLKKNDVKGGALYAEYRTDDARLTIEIIKTAQRFGAHVINYCRVTALLHTDDKIEGVSVHDEIHEQKFDIRARAVVNATGPWVDELRAIDHSKTGKRLHLTKGVHLVVAHERFPIRQAIYFDVADGRMIFAIPRGRTTYIGTTDTNYEGAIDDVRTTKADESYLIDGVNRTFPSIDLKSGDIVSSWAGLRPLIHEEGKSASELSRKDEIFESPSGLISIAGGKLTGYRKMAERIVDLLVDKIFSDRKDQVCVTSTTPLVTGGFKNYEDVKLYEGRLTDRIFKLGLPAATTPYLVGNYGRQADGILARMGPGIPADELMRAEIHFTIEHEMVIKPLDFIVRRTGMLYFYRSRIEESMDIILNEFKQHFNWTTDQLEMEKQKVEMSIIETTKFV